MKWLNILISLLFVACAQTPKTSKTALYEQGVTVGEGVEANRYANIYFSGQPSSKDWAHLKSQGFTHIINIREAKEIDGKMEKETIQSQGMIYSHIPMNAKKPLTKGYVQSVTKAVMTHRKKGKTLIHCGSGNRVAYWVGAHFYLDHNYSAKDSIDMAKKMGLTSSGLETKLEKFISDNKVIKK